MRYLASLLFISLLGLTSAQTRPAADNCLKYEPDAVTLTGTIRQQTFPGPPNYESVAKGDAAEKIWMLHLQKPICVAASTDQEREENVSDVQLVLGDQKQYEKYRPLLRRTVTASGTLFHATTGHHHTKVLLTVSDLKRAAE